MPNKTLRDAAPLSQRNVETCREDTDRRRPHAFTTQNNRPFNAGTTTKHHTTKPKPIPVPAIIISSIPTDCYSSGHYLLYTDYYPTSPITIMVHDPFSCCPTGEATLTQIYHGNYVEGFPNFYWVIVKLQASKGVIPFTTFFEQHPDDPYMTWATRLLDQSFSPGNNTEFEVIAHSSFPATIPGDLAVEAARRRLIALHPPASVATALWHGVPSSLTYDPKTNIPLVVYIVSKSLSSSLKASIVSAVLSITTINLSPDDASTQIHTYHNYHVHSASHLELYRTILHRTQLKGTLTSLHFLAKDSADFKSVAESYPLPHNCDSAFAHSEPCDLIAAGLACTITYMSDHPFAILSPEIEQIGPRATPMIRQMSRLVSGAQAPPQQHSHVSSALDCGPRRYSFPWMRSFQYTEGFISLRKVNEYPKRLIFHLGGEWLSSMIDECLDCSLETIKHPIIRSPPLPSPTLISPAPVPKAQSSAIQSFHSSSTMASPSPITLPSPPNPSTSLPPGKSFIRTTQETLSTLTASASLMSASLNEIKSEINSLKEVSAYLEETTNFLQDIQVAEEEEDDSTLKGQVSSLTSRIMYIQCCISRMYSELNIKLPTLSGDEAITETEKAEVEAIIAELNAQHMN
jgi:hypothetical protein